MVSPDVGAIPPHGHACARRTTANTQGGRSLITVMFASAFQLCILSVASVSSVWQGDRLTRLENHTAQTEDGRPRTKTRLNTHRSVKHVLERGTHSKHKEVQANPSRVCDARQSKPPAGWLIYQPPHSQGFAFPNFLEHILHISDSSANSWILVNFISSYTATPNPMSIAFLLLFVSFGQAHEYRKAYSTGSYTRSRYHHLPPHLLFLRVLWHSSFLQMSLRINTKLLGQ